METDIAQINKNLITSLYFSAGYEGIYYLQTSCSLYLFKRDALLKNYDFLAHYMYAHKGRNLKWKFGVLDKTCWLYQEHKHAFDNGEILYKYICRIGLISKNVISYDEETQKMYLESSYLGLDNYKVTDDCVLLYKNQDKREIFDGITLQDYLKNKDYVEKITIYRMVLDYLFESYSSAADPTKVDGIVLDCHNQNIIISQNNIHMIDQEIVYKTEIAKNMAIYRLCSQYYDYFVKYYNLPDIPASEYQEYPTDNQNTQAMKTAAKKNADLIRKYFSDKGLEKKNDVKLALVFREEDLPKALIEAIDSSWYVEHYPDCLSSNLTPKIYYLKTGWKRGDNPSPYFDGNRYLKENPDVVKSRRNPLEHYINNGQKEGRQIYPIQDVENKDETVCEKAPAK